MPFILHDMSILLVIVTVIYTDTLPRLQRALEEAEIIFQQLSVKQYQVWCCHGSCAVANGNQQSCIIQKKHNNPLDHVSAVESSDLVMYVAVVMSVAMVMYATMVTVFPQLIMLFQLVPQCGII